MAVVNAHTHLELSDLGGERPASPSDFFPWLQNLARRLPQRSHEQVVRACEVGIDLLLRAGTTHVGDISSTGFSVAPLARSGLSGIVWIELIALTREHVRTRLPQVMQCIEQARKQLDNSNIRIGLSPHAPYSVHPAAWEGVLQMAEREALPLCIHVAESPAEWELFTRGTGPLLWFEGWMALPRLPRTMSWRAARMAATCKPVLRRLGYPYPLSRRQSPTAYLEQQGVLAQRPLLVHMVQVDADDIERVRRSGATVVHCPRSNQLLRCGRMPLERFVAAGIPVLLGTDSLASSPSLDVGEEAQAAVQLHAGIVGAQEILRMMGDESAMVQSRR